MRGEACREVVGGIERDAHQRWSLQPLRGCFGCLQARSNLCEQISNGEPAPIESAALIGIVRRQRAERLRLRPPCRALGKPGGALC